MDLTFHWEICGLDGGMEVGEVAGNWLSALRIGGYGGTEWGGGGWAGL